MAKYYGIMCVLLVVSLLFVSGCEQLDLSKISEEDVNKVIVCEAPYIRHATGCCLDQNENKVCDKDEGIATQPEPSTSSTPEENTQPIETPEEPISDLPSEEKLSCSTDVKIRVSDVSYSGNKMSATVENLKKAIDSFLMEVSGSDGADSVTVYERLGESDIKTFVFEFDKSTIGIVEKVDIIPQLKINEGLYARCSEQKVVWYLETSQESEPELNPCITDLNFQIRNVSCSEGIGSANEVIVENKGNIDIESVEFKVHYENGIVSSENFIKPGVEMGDSTTFQVGIISGTTTKVEAIATLEGGHVCENAMASFYIDCNG